VIIVNVSFEVRLIIISDNVRLRAHDVTATMQDTQLHTPHAIRTRARLSDLSPNLVASICVFPLFSEPFWLEIVLALRSPRKIRDRVTFL